VTPGWPAGDACALAVVGGGPAGLATATLAAELGIETVLLDEQPSPGGQIYRGVGDAPRSDPAILGAAYGHGRMLLAAFRASSARYVAEAVVWSVAPGGEIAVSVAGTARRLQARHVVLATGALERPFPIPGWTLPGVMTVGGAQILLKSAGLVAEGRVVLAGSGPLLWLFAAQHLRAGGRIAAWLDTTPAANRRAALRWLPAFLASADLLPAARLLAEVGRRIRRVRSVTRLAAMGDGRLREVVYATDTGREQRLAADLLLLHQGVVPDLNLAAAAGCRLGWDEAGQCFRPETDAWGIASVEGIGIAGDAAGIAGAAATIPSGRLAALTAAYRLGAIDRTRRDRDAVLHRAALRRAARGRLFLDHLHRPAPAFRLPAGDTLVCRCEEVTAQQVLDAVALGATGPNQVKAFLRCGMGPCQGRFCGLTVTELIAAARGVTPAETGYFRLRPPVRPITLAELAAMPRTPADIQAVERG
jgi:NADPH-dependent 2,4-dienoyl-CoA reductase/sulfur reductase-like enzyme